MRWEIETIFAIQGEKEAQLKLYQVEAEIDAKNWEKRNRDCSFQNINQEFGSQRFRWAHRAQKDKISLYGEMELRSGLFQENHARDCQEIEELSRRCCEEIEQTRQARSEELSLQQRRNPTTMSQMMAQIQDLQNKLNSFSDAREFFDPESRSSSGATHVPDQTSTVLNSRKLPRCDSAAKHTELCKHSGKRFSTTTCSRRTIFYNLQQFNEFGIFISRYETWNYKHSTERYEKGIIEYADSTTSLPK